MDKKKLTTLILISAAGLLLTWWGLHTGASQAALAEPFPTPVPPQEGDTFILDTLHAQVLPVQRIQTLTLMPLAPLPEEMYLLDQLISDTWPVRVNEVFYNRPPGEITTLPADA